MVSLATTEGALTVTGDEDGCASRSTNAERMVAVTCSLTMARMWAMSTLVESVVGEDPEGPGTETSDREGVSGRSFAMDGNFSVDGVG